MTDQEKKELREAHDFLDFELSFNNIDLNSEDSSTRALANKRFNTFNLLKDVSKKLLDASENMPHEREVYDSYDYGFNACLNLCTHTVAANYINKKDLPSEEEICEIIQTHIPLGMYTIRQSCAKAIHDRIMGGK